MEHHDQLAIAALRDLLADAADLPPAPEIAHAQAELARALMLAGSSAESVAWCDRVLANPGAATPEVLLEAVVTKGTALANTARVVEAEALLRGAVAIADDRGNLESGLRARNNLRVLLQWQDLAEALALTLEVRDIARRFGIQSWVLHGIGASRDVSFRTGDWDAYLDDVQSELENAGAFYSAWFAMEAGRREVYQGDARRAEAVFDANLANAEIAASGQGTTWNLAAKADALIAQGRFHDAIEPAERGRVSSSENDLPQLALLFAGVALGDPAIVRRTRDGMRDQGFDQLTGGRGFIAAADSLLAALEGRWDDARAAQQVAEGFLTEVGEWLVNARFGLALGHLAGDRLPEAARAGADAERWFAERGAAHYVSSYRAAAAKAGNDAPPAGTPATGRREQASSVRAGG
jgi:hypothetical protein